MKVKENKFSQELRLKEIVLKHNLNYEYLKSMLESVKRKKMNRKNNYHQSTINELIEKL